MTTNLSAVATRRQLASHGTEGPRGPNGPPPFSASRGLLKVEEAAQWLGLGRTKAYELVYSGALPSVTIGRSRRVPAAALEEFVRKLIENGGAL